MTFEGITQATYADVAVHGWRMPEQLNMAEEVCDRWAAACPDRPAILDLTGDAREVTTYGALRRMADSLAHALHRRGVGPGDRVGIFRTQSAWTAAAHIAVWKLGAISIPLFTLFGPDALAVRLVGSGAKALVCDPESLIKISNIQRDAKVSLEVLAPEDLDQTDDVFETARTGPEDPAVLIYTSGTTGPPKGALHGHRILRGHLPGVELSHDLLPQADDVLWTPADWAWIGGLFDVLMPGLWHGVPVVAARLGKFTPEAALRVIDLGKVRNIFFPPTALRVLKAADVTCGGLRSVASGGEPLGAEMLAWGRDALGLTINEFYGQTECNMTVSSCGARFPARPGWIGRVVPGHDVAVIDADASGEGDIAVRRGSASMLLGYWNNAEATQAKFRGDWWRTGDRGFAEGGYIRFAGREDDVITSAGYRIGPAEVEDCLLTHPAVASVGVVGVPDQQRTEVVAAFVVLKPDFSPSYLLKRDLQAHVKTRLAAHEYPRRLTFVAELPLTVTGKIIRRELRRIAAEEVSHEQTA